MKKEISLTKPATIPDTKTGTPPIIIIGMHRSGTTMITDMLERLGLFMGWMKQENEEAMFFVERNEKLMTVCGGSWEYPKAVDELIAHPQLRQRLSKRLEQDVESMRFSSFLGVSRRLRYRSSADFDFTWGWKDPRNSFLLPLWLDTFPEARIIHIYRNGIDVACSLATRGSRSAAANTDRVTKRGPFDRLRDHMRKEKAALYFYRRIGSLRNCLGPLAAYNHFRVNSTSDLDQGFDLWRTYTERCIQHVDERPALSLTVKYEDFLLSPESELSRIVNFCQLPTDKERIQSMCSLVRPDRRYAFLNNPVAVELYESVRTDPTMSRLGYNSIL